MRSSIGFSWVVVAAVGWAAFGCGSADSEAGRNGSGGNAGDTSPWLVGSGEEPFPNEAEGSDTKLGTGGASGGPGQRQPAGGTGGGGGTQTGATNLSTLCPGYDQTKYSHTLTAAARDPGNMASATRARELLGKGQTPVPGAVRAADFVSYHAKAPATDVAEGVLAGKVELRTRKIEGVEIPNQYDLFVGVAAGAVARPQVVMTVIVDSTLTPSALARAKATIEGLAKGLKPGDHVTLLSADESLQPVELDLSTNSGNELSQLAAQIAVGTGSVAARLPAAYAKAKAAPPGTWNRIVVVSDGEEDVNAPNYALIESEAANSKIFLTAIGVSPESNYGDALLYRLSHQGRGRYLYVDAVDEPAALFSARFDEIFGIARDKVRIRVDLPSYMRALDPEPEGGSGAGARDKYLAPGEWQRFVFHLSACSKNAYLDPTVGWEPLTVTVDSTLADGQTAPPFPLVSQPVKKFLAVTDNPQLNQMAAIQSFVDALKYPMDTRFLDAKAQLQALTASPGPELLALLGQHPSFPKP